jgi:hypothetical protein
MLKYKSRYTKIRVSILLLVTLKGRGSYLICNLIHEFLYVPLKEKHTSRVYVNKKGRINMGSERKIKIQ